MNVPAYASHLTEEIYQSWEYKWRYMYLKERGEGVYRLPEIRNACDARALIAIAALDEGTIARLDHNAQDGIGLGGRPGSFETITALLKYHSKDSQAAFNELGLSLRDNRFALNENKKFYLFAYLAEVYTYLVRCNADRLINWKLDNTAALEAMAEYADTLPIEEEGSKLSGIDYQSIDLGRSQFYFAKFYNEAFNAIKNFSR